MLAESPPSGRPFSIVNRPFFPPRGALVQNWRTFKFFGNPMKDLIKNPIPIHKECKIKGFFGIKTVERGYNLRGTYIKDIKLE